MIIVKKRGCSRFFAKNSHQLYNPAPGTIIDHTITHQNWFDFYLISQCARQGTAAPTHFNVIWGRVSNNSFDRNSSEDHLTGENENPFRR